MSQTTTTWSLTLSATFLLIAAWLYQDYRAWIAFGTGGTPPNIQGYLKITKFRILRAWSGDDLRDPWPLLLNGQSYLQVDLPQRKGSPPEIIPRTLPQRQYPVPLDNASTERLHSLPKKYAEILNDIIDLDKSVTEKRSTDAIYAKPDRSCGAHDPILGNEIAHVHTAENSLHVWLTQADARKVITARWGERFPLSSLGMVDSGWTFVYTPRSMEEVSVVGEIVKAGIGHLTGRKV